jgi:hypothetical protein
MQRLLIITTTSDRSKCYQLERSLKLHGYNYHIIEHTWDGFLGKLHHTYQYLRTLKGYTHFLYTDAWDTIAMRPDVMVPDGVLISAERACYPYPEWAAKYPASDSPWRYVNGGGWCGEISAFIKMYESKPPTDEMNDQVWLTERFLAGWGSLDYQCEVFQTLGFCPESDFRTPIVTGYKESDIAFFFNNITDSHPAFIHGNGHTPMTHIYALLPTAMNTLNEAASQWQDTPEAHKRMHDEMVRLVNDTMELKEYRDWIEAKIFGFGERSFLWMWKLILQELPPDAKLLEIGVFRGQVLGLWRMLAPDADIAGITPLDSSDGHWESDYAADIKYLHETFKLPQPRIVKGLSTDDFVKEQIGMYDVIYIDGGHTYEVARHDVYYFSSHVKLGGYLVIDDCANRYRLPDGMFKGIEPVSRAVDELLPNGYYKEVLSVVHNRIFKRIK